MEKGPTRDIKIIQDTGTGGMVIIVFKSRSSCMIFASVSQFHIDLPLVNTCFVYHSVLIVVLNVKVLIGSFNQEIL